MNTYFTTPLYYANANPHLGTAYSTIIADVFHLYSKLYSNDSLLLTGMDEHGQKIQQAAEGASLTPLQHCDNLAEVFINCWKELNIHHDIFYRTTQTSHYEVVSNLLQKLYDKGDIYSKDYEGWYCVSEETFYQEKDLVNGKTPTGKDVEQVVEKNYFFKMSNYQDQLIQYINDNPSFIQPDFRKNEVLGFLKQPLLDLSISRPKERIQWGIPLPFDPDHTTYVWVDALTNYAAAAGLYSDESKFNKIWNEGHVTHFIGKDIIKTHAVYWTTLLMALDIELPNHIYAHGWILNREGKKMSKSEGDTLNPFELVKELGTSGLKYYLSRGITFGQDAPMDKALIYETLNTDLSNNFGNLLSRSTNLIAKFFDGQVPYKVPQDSLLKEDTINLASKVKEHLDNYKLKRAIEEVLQVLTKTNQYLEQNQPWKTVKVNPETAAPVLLEAAEVIRIATILMSPLLDDKAETIFKSLGLDPKDQTIETCYEWGGINHHKGITKVPPLFPRFVT